MITSRHHPLVKQFRALARGGSGLLLDGWHLLEEALGTGLAVDLVALSAEPDAAERRILARARATGARVHDVSPAVMDALSPVTSPSGVVASAARPALAAQALVTPAPALVLAAFGVQDPGNLGAVVRSAAAAGATGVAVDGESADPWGWKALRAAMGSTFRLPLLREPTLSGAIADWRQLGLTIIAAVPRDGRSPYDADLRRPMALLVGGEGPGLPPDVADAADHRVTIPMAAGVESLNVAVAAAVLLYEARRQRNTPRRKGHKGARHVAV